MLLMLI